MTTIESKWITRFYADPVMAAYVLLGERLDTFQRARLRFLWFVPNKCDSSGWSTGKTRVEWIYAVLRAALIPKQVVGVYYPIFQTGKDTFWKYFSDIRPEQLVAQYLPGRDAESKDPGCWKRSFRNGSTIQLPAPGFLNDANNQASRRFNTMIIGEYTQAAMKGEGVDELIGRCSEPNWNKNHPIWGNHYLLSAHAESRTHPGYKYYKGIYNPSIGMNRADEIQKNVTFSFCYRDWSDRPIDPKRPSETFKKKLRDDDAIRRSMRTLSKQGIREKIFGLWGSGGTGWYDEESMRRGLRSNLVPLLARPSTMEGWVFTLGIDTAPGMSEKADQCAATVEAGRPCHGHERPTFITEEGVPWISFPVFAHIFKAADAPLFSGYIHSLHWRYSFARIVMDPGGGGAWVYKELKKPQQIIDGVSHAVTPLVTEQDAIGSEGQSIVSFFKRGSDLDVLWQGNFLAGDDGIVEAAHRLHREAVHSGPWPQLAVNRHPGQKKEFTKQQFIAQANLDAVYRQLTQINVKTMKDNTGNDVPAKSARGFVMFNSKIKKDAAYSKLYAHCGIRLAAHGGGVTGQEYEDPVC